MCIYIYIYVYIVPSAAHLQRRNPERRGQSADFASGIYIYIYIYIYDINSIIQTNDSNSSII